MQAQEMKSGPGSAPEVRLQDDKQRHETKSELGAAPARLHDIDYPEDDDYDEPMDIAPTPDDIFLDTIHTKKGEREVLKEQRAVKATKGKRIYVANGQAVDTTYLSAPDYGTAHERNRFWEQRHYRMANDPMYIPDRYAEAPTNISGLFVDMDCFQRDATSYITIDAVEKVCTETCSIIAQMFNLDGCTHLDVAILTKPLGVDKKVPAYKPAADGTARYKHGWHMYFPNVQMSLDARKLVLLMLRSSDTVESFTAKHGLMQNPIDLASASVPNYLIGCSRGRVKHELVRVMKYKIGERDHKLKGFGDSVWNQGDKFDKLMPNISIPFEFAVCDWGPRYELGSQVGDKAMPVYCRKVEYELSPDGLDHMIAMEDIKASDEADAVVEDSKFSPTEAESKDVAASPGEFYRLIEQALSLVDRKFRDSTPEWVAMIGCLKNICMQFGVPYRQVFEAFERFSEPSPAHVSRADTLRNWRTIPSRSFGVPWLFKKIKDNGKAEELGELVCQWQRSYTTPKWWNSYRRAKRFAVPMFDSADPYCWADFCREHQRAVYDSKLVMENTVKANISRVFALVKRICDIAVIKSDLRDGLFSTTKLCSLYRESKLSFSYKDGVKKDQTPNIVEMPFEVFIKHHQHEMTMYREVGCSPIDRAGMFNMWQGVRARAADDGIGPEGDDWIDFIRTTICSGDTKLFLWLVMWMRILVCKQEIKPGFVPYLYGKQALGKNVFVEFIHKWLIGEAGSFECAGLGKVVGKFNKHLEGRRLCIINEMCESAAEFKSDFAIFKTLITEARMTIEPKFMNPINVDNHLAFIITSNDHSLNLDPSDRRFLCVSVSEAHREDRAYFKSLCDRFYTAEYANRFCRWLLDFDESLLPTEEKLHKTELHKDMTLESMSSSKKFLMYIKGLVGDGEDSDEKDADEPSPAIAGERAAIEKEAKLYRCEVPASELYKRYLAWCDRNGMKSRVDNVKFSMQIKEHLQHRRTSKAVVYDTRTITLGD